MPGFGAILSNIGIPLANTVAANNFAQKAEDDKQRQIAMTALAQMRQERLDAQNAEHIRAQDDYLNRGRLGNGVTYRSDAEGNLMQLPTSGGMSQGPSDRVPPPTITPSAAPSAPPVAGLNAPIVPRSTPSVNGPTGNIDLSQGDAGIPPQGTPSTPTIGRPTGIKMAVKPIPVPKVPVTPLSDKLQARVAELTAGGMSLAKASDQARQEFGQMLQVPGTQSGTILPGANDQPPQMVVTSTRDPSQLGKKIAIPGVVKTPPGNANAQVEKEKTFVDMMESSLPTMQALAHKVRPAAITAATIYPNAANPALTADEQRFLQSARTFIAGTLHQESGARLSAEQWKIGLERYLPTIGDYDTSIDQKIGAAAKATADRRAQVNAAGGGRGGGKGGGNPDQAPPPASPGGSVARKYGITPSGDEE